jgi:hypothetical protein
MEFFSFMLWYPFHVRKLTGLVSNVSETVSDSITGGSRNVRYIIFMRLFAREDFMEFNLHEVSNPLLQLNMTLIRRKYVLDSVGNFPAPARMLPSPSVLQDNTSGL